MKIFVASTDTIVPLEAFALQVKHYPDDKEWPYAVCAVNGNTQIDIEYYSNQENAMEAIQRFADLIQTHYSDVDVIHLIPNEVLIINNLARKQENRRH